MRPKLRITINKGHKGVPLEKLANTARDTKRFLESLGHDLGFNGGDWVADNFSNGSVVYDLSNPDIGEREGTVWCRAIRAVAAQDVVDDEVNLMLSRRTRRSFVDIASALDPDEVLEIGLFTNGHVEPDDVFKIDRSLLTLFENERPREVTYHGEIQGVVHAFYKEAKRPKLSIRDLSTRALVDCYFKKEMYQGVVDLLRDEDAVIFVEGEVSEDVETGVVREIDVTEFTPAPDFDADMFESRIGSFPNALTGGRDTATLMDDFRDT